MFAAVPPRSAPLTAAYGARWLRWRSCACSLFLLGVLATEFSWFAPASGKDKFTCPGVIEPQQVCPSTPISLPLFIRPPTPLTMRAFETGMVQGRIRVAIYICIVTAVAAGVLRCRLPSPELAEEAKEAVERAQVAIQDVRNVESYLGHVIVSLTAVAGGGDGVAAATQAAIQAANDAQTSVRRALSNVRRLEAAMAEE
jgi:hypothetical protein